MAEVDAFDVRRAYADHGSVIFGFALNATHDRSLAEECVQETFVRAWRGRDGFRSELGSERTWLFAIARNVLADLFRARSRRPMPVAEPAEASPAALEAGRTTGAYEWGTERVLDRVTIVSALSRLSAAHREVVVAVAIRQQTYQSLSELTGVPVATLRTRMYHALRALRSHLVGEGDGHD